MRMYNLGVVTAYGLAVKQGFRGTEQEWLESLRGPSGRVPEITATKADGVLTIYADGVVIGSLLDGDAAYDDSALRTLIAAKADAEAVNTRFEHIETEIGDASLLLSLI